MSLKQMWVLDPGFAADADIPEEVKKAVRKMGRDRELSNDSYFEWDREDYFGDPGEEWAGKPQEEIDEFFDVRPEHYTIDKFLMEKGIEKAIILYWW